jgi:mannose-6-phosphate isomerase
VSLHRLRGVVQHYAWGDTTAIPRWMNVAPDGRPWAELWFGTHHNGHAALDSSTDAHDEPLASVAGRLPYLVKVLAAAQPLSLQTHPSAEQAVAGFARENASGIAITDPRRIYVDASPKPEFIYALTAFEAVCGFLDDDAAITSCTSAGAPELAGHVEEHGLANTVRTIVSGSHGFVATNPPAHVRFIADSHPDDPRAVVALLMHHVRLAPGDTLFLESGNVHAYLRGTAIEVMSSSDNVVRAAFTTKHVDADEFTRVATLAPTAPLRPTPHRDADGDVTYRPAGAPFVVRIVRIDGERDCSIPTGGAILLPARGDVTSLGATAAFADAGRVQLHGNGDVVMVSSS